MADEFDKLVYVLSTLLHGRKHSPLKSVIKHPSEKRKLLGLLNDIALALTTRASGDVTAVMMKQSANAIEFFYSKNAPCNGSLDVYLQSIKEALANNDVEVIQIKILEAVLSSCVDKFKNRAIKCKKAAESCNNNIASSEDNGTPKNLSDVLKRWDGLSSTEIITRFLKSLRKLDTSIQALKANVKKCMVISQEACMIGLGKSLQQYPTLLRRIQKLGAYFGIAWRVRKMLKDPNFFKIRGNISFVEIPPRPQKTFVVTRDLAKILNDNAIMKSHGDQVTPSDIESKYPNQSSLMTGSVSITVSAHCELTLALHALNSPSKPKNVEIGVSKTLCWLCQEFVENLKDAGAIRVFVSENQGKMHAGWTIPPNTPSGVEFDMRKLVEEEIEELRARIIACRRSDSFPNELQDEFTDKDNHYCTS